MPETATAQKTLNGRVAPPRTARIVGLGHKLPERVVPNGPIAERIGVDGDWITRRTGIRLGAELFECAKPWCEGAI